MLQLQKSWLTYSDKKTEKVKHSIIYIIECYWYYYISFGIEMSYSFSFIAIKKERKGPKEREKTQPFSTLI